MNRREFLKTLGLLGISITLPIGVDVQSDTEIEAIRHSLEQNPFLFHVCGHSGTISIPEIPIPRTRAELFDILPTRFDSPQSLVCEAYSCYPLRESLVRFCLEKKSEFYAARGDHRTALEYLEMETEDVEYHVLEEWIIKADEIEYASVRQFAEDWLQDSYDGWDTDYAPKYTDPVGAAYVFFDDPDMYEFREELSVVLVEGDRPGSDYIAAELESSIEEANEAAERLGLPFRFARGEMY